MIEKNRCGWVNSDPLYIKYHDEEWGKPVLDDAKMFEFLLLESFQAGLSWLTILRKRENFRTAFDNFDYRKIADYKESKENELMENAGIIRNIKKIKAAINNAGCFMEVQDKYGSFCDFLWNYVDGVPLKSNFSNYKELPATTPLSDKISKDLKKMGFKFVGSTTIYAHLQASGIVNDHTKDCFKYEV